MKVESGLLVSFALVAMLPSNAGAETAVFSGLRCQQNNTYDFERVAVHTNYYDAIGITHTQTNRDVRVLCPLDFTRTASDGGTYLEIVPTVFGRSIVMNVRDLSPTAGVGCAMGGLTSGASWFGPTRYTCGLLGSCDTDSVPGYVTGSVATSALFVYALHDANWITPYVQCTLPNASSGLGLAGASVIQAYRLSYNP